LLAQFHADQGAMAEADRDLEILAARRAVYERARRRNPERWARHQAVEYRPATVTLHPEADHAVAKTDRLAA
jgi:hypothetical protein